MRYPFFFLESPLPASFKFGSLFYPPGRASSKKTRSRTKIFSRRGVRSRHPVEQGSGRPTAAAAIVPAVRTIRSAILVLLWAGALAAAAGCGERSDLQIARRILEDHRKRARVKPLPAAQVLRLAYSAPAGRATETGTGRIEWEGANYRETVSSAGWTIVQGVQAGKAFWTDEDGVTRVASEPVLSALLTRFYFWRRAYLFDDLEGAKLGLGSADDTTVSVELSPRGGNPLRLSFNRAGDLVSARSPRFDLEFRDPRHFADRSRPEAPLDVELRSSSLPSSSLEDVQAGGWSARWRESPAEAPMLAGAGAIAVDGDFAGKATRICVDAAAEGPVEIRSDLSGRAGMSPRSDVLGRRVARGQVAVGALSFPSVFFSVSEELPRGCDARAGALFLRETIVELDAASGKVRFYDPQRWSAPPGYFRGLLDDDGDRPVAILRHGSQSVRLRAGIAGVSGVVLAPEAARRLGVSRAGPMSGLTWGTAEFPLAEAEVEESRFDPAWGDDGALGLALLLKFHTFLDLPKRWAYLRPLDEIR